MNPVLEDCYEVYVRDRQPRDQWRPTERRLASCPSYEEARRYRDELRSPCYDCVIRYIGPAGGGD